MQPVQPGSQGLCSSWRGEIFGTRSSLPVDFSFFHCCSKKRGLSNKGTRGVCMQATIPTELLENVFCEYALPYATKVFPNQELYPEKTPSPRSSLLPYAQGWGFFFSLLQFQGEGEERIAMATMFRKLLSKYAFSLWDLSMILAGCSLQKHPFLLALRRWGRFARRNVCDSAAEIPYWWRKPMFK